MKKLPPPPDFDENPEWTEADFAQARPASEVLPPEVAAALRRPGRPIGSRSSDRKQVTLRLPRSVIEHFKAGGPGWQTRAVAVLEREATGSR
ncbi:MAG: BrnA antitoxin family protein [Caulobacteraceae bacterium]